MFIKPFTQSDESLMFVYFVYKKNANWSVIITLEEKS